MALHGDATTKQLVEERSSDWLELCRRFFPGDFPEISGPLKPLNADLASVTALVDKLIQVGIRKKWLVHFEFQLRYDRKMGLRLCRYSSLIEYRHQLPVLSVLILLDSKADGPAMSGVLHRRLPGGYLYDEYRYHVIRVWELPVESILNGGFGTLPLAPLCNVSKAELPRVIHRMAEIVEKGPPTLNKKEFWTATGILLGAKFQRDFVEQLLRGVFDMRESSVVQGYLEEGRREGQLEGLERGLERGLAEGQLQEARRYTYRLIEHRFGKVNQTLKQHIESLLDLGEIEAVGSRVLDATTWRELIPK